MEENLEHTRTMPLFCHSQKQNIKLLLLHSFKNSLKKSFSYAIINFIVNAHVFFLFYNIMNLNEILC